MGADQQGSIMNSTPNIPPATSITDFETIKSLGQGTFATVYLVRRIANNQLYALKVIKKQLVLQSNELEHTNAELKILSQLNHPNLVKLHGAFQNADNLYLVLDFMNGGELFHHLQKKRHFDEKVAQMFVAQLVLALQELHSKQIIMRDLKPENILLGSDGYIKVTDFGLSKLSKTGGVVVGTTFCGTAEYLSPEQLRNQPHGVEVDYWALGVIAYELMAGLPPFYNRDHKTMFKLILKGEPKFNESIFSQQAQSFIRQCLEKDPKKRLGTGGNFAQFKAHPWFSKLDWEKLYQKQYDLDYKPEKHLNANNVDLSNFDTRFTNQQINMEDVMGLDKTDITNQELFEGFDVDSKIVEKILQEKMKKAEKEQIENMQMMGCADDHESQSTSQQQQRKRDVSQKKKKVRQEDEDLDQELSM